MIILINLFVSISVLYVATIFCIVLFYNLKPSRRVTFFASNLTDNQIKWQFNWIQKVHFLTGSRSDSSSSVHIQVFFSIWNFFCNVNARKIIIIQVETIEWHEFHVIRLVIYVLLSSILYYIFLASIVPLYFKWTKCKIIGWPLKLNDSNLCRVTSGTKKICSIFLSRKTQLNNGQSRLRLI